MPKLRIAEFDRMLPVSKTGGLAQVLMLPAVVQTPMEITSGSTKSAAITAKSMVIVQLDAEADCHIEVGEDPTATVNSKRLVAGRLEHFGITPGHKIAVIAAAG